MTDMVGKILHNRYKILRPVGVGRDQGAPRERAVASRPCNVILT